MHTEKSKNMFVVVDNKVFQEHDTVVHIYRFRHTNVSSDQSKDDVQLDIQRTQMVSTLYDLQNSTLFFYTANRGGHLFMVFCEGNALYAMSQKRCEYFLWKNDGVDESNGFQSINDFELIENTLLYVYSQTPVSHNNKILMSNNVLAFQINVSEKIFKRLVFITFVFLCRILFNPRVCRNILLYLTINRINQNRSCLQYHVKVSSS